MTQKFYLEFNTKEHLEMAIDAIRSEGLSAAAAWWSQADLHSPCEQNATAANEALAERDVEVHRLQNRIEVLERDASESRVGMANLGEQLETAVESRDRAVNVVEELRRQASGYAAQVNSQIQQLMAQRDAALQDSERMHAITNDLVLGIKALTSLVDPA